jgi:cysteine synthase A
MDGGESGYPEAMSVYPPTPAGVGAPAASVLEAIGQTPLIALDRLFAERPIRVHAKLEQANPAGSAKDRPAASMLADALAGGQIEPGDTVIESSSGNMGVGLAQACAVLGLRLVCVTDLRTKPQSVGAMRALGAEVLIVERPDPATGDWLRARIALVERLLVQRPGATWLDQYANPANPGAHREGTAREIWAALGGELDALFVATGTGGTMAGCVEFLDEQGSSAEVIAVDAVGSALFAGKPGPRLLPGLGAGFETDHTLRSRPDRVLRVDELDCVVGCRRLARAEGILAGASSGGVITAIERVAAGFEAGLRCAAILPDGGFGYLDTVYDDDWVERELGTRPDELAALVTGEERSATP